MRILRLSFANLNSLRGNSPTLDFCAPPLANSGLFLICGPTGAGKTTILDAITLALFGKAARYAGEANPEQMMSRHASECHSEVEFECGGKAFRCLWRLRRARGKTEGAVQQPIRRLIELPTEIVLAEQIRAVDSQVEAITGLNFDRFLRSVMLAQGEFAAFLKMEVKERTALLQQVTGTHVYAEISKAAHERKRLADESLKNLRVRQDAALPLPSDERIAREAEVSLLVSRSAETEITVTEIGRRLAAAEAATRIATEKATLDQESADWTVARAQFAETELALISHFKALPMQGALADLKNAQTNLQRLQSECSILAENLPLLRDQMQIREETARTSKQLLVEWENKEQFFRPLLREVIELDQKIQAGETVLKDVSTTVSIAQRKVLDLADAAKLDTEACAKLREELAQTKRWLEAHKLDAALDAIIAEATTSLERWKEKHAQVQQLEQELNHQGAYLADLRRNLQDQDAREQSLGQAATQAEAETANAQQALFQLESGVNLTEWEYRRNSAVSRRQQWEDAARLAAILDELERSLKSQEDDLRDGTARLTRAAEKITKAQETLDQAENFSQAKRETVSLAERIQSLETQRADLRSGQPCPLCGALEHPFADPIHSPPPELARLRQELSLAVAAVKSRQAEVEQARTDAARADQQVALAKKAASEISNKLLRQAEEWNRCGVGLALDQRGKVTSHLAEAKQEEDFLSHRLQSLHAAQGAFNEKRAAAAEANMRWQEVKQQQAGLIAQVENERRHEIAQREKLAGARAAENEEAKRTGIILEGATEPRSTTSETTATILRLAERSRRFAESQAAAGDLEKKLDTHEALANERSRQLEERKIDLGTLLKAENEARHDQVMLIASRREKFGEKSTKEEEWTFAEGIEAARLAYSRAVSASQEATLSVKQALERHRQLEEEINKADQLLIHQGSQLRSAAQEAGFAGSTQVEQAILSADLTEAWSKRQQGLRDQGVALQTKQTKLAADSQNVSEEAWMDATRRPELETFLAETRAALGRTQEQLGGLRTQLNADEELRGRHAALAADIDNAERDVSRWGRLGALIGSASGQTFARFAQALTLQRLVTLANRHLTVLNPRYTLRRNVQDEADLELEIVDHFQAGATRRMQSLSGGETFLASLALALGLSELAGGRSSIDSLFIDEGFGALDADMLETAMSALENLRASGKTIGIISHVEALKDRITTQIRVTSSGSGLSRIEVVG